MAVQQIIQLASAPNLHHFLRADSGEIARIQLDGATGTLICEGDHWGLQRETPGPAAALIRLLTPDGAVIARFIPRWTGWRTLIFGDGRRFHWRGLMARREARWCADNRRSVMHFNHQADDCWEVRAQTQGLSDADARLLMVFGWYLLLEEEQQFASGVLHSIYR